MNEEMKFPNTIEEFIEQYSFIDKKQIYTNGSELIQVFRIMQWENHKQQENKQLKEELEKIKQPTIFIDTQNMEERYGEQLYQDYLVEQNKYLQQRIDKAIEYIETATICPQSIYHYRNCLYEILKGSEQ